MKTTVILRSLMLLAIIFTGLHTHAGDVSLTIAKNVALNLFTERANNADPYTSIANVTEIKHDGVTLFYILQYSKTGFALISADDRVQPILGYSFQSNYNPANLPPAFQSFIIDRFIKEIKTAKAQKLNPRQKTVDAWTKYSQAPGFVSADAITVIDPLLTSTWDQDWPYNAHCPADAGGPNGHVVVGCVATAMAQVLNFWQHPWHGEGSHTYTPEDHPEYGPLSVNFGNTYYNFDLMKDNATVYQPDLADLSYHCAVAVDMNFGPGSSGAWGDGSEDVGNALRNYFYFNSACEDISRSDYDENEWIDLLKVEVNSGRPVIYGAHDEAAESGHAWVIDGVSATDEFHCNWGWGGSSDGYFSINNLNPGTHNYDSQDHACINIKPKTGTVSGTYTLAGSPYVFHYDHIVEPGQTLNIEAGVDIIFDGRYKLIVQGQINAQGNYGGYIHFHPQHPTIGMQGLMFEDLNLNSMDSSKLINCIFENGKGYWDPYSKVRIGGGIYCTNSSKVLIENSRVSQCSADYGGGIACMDTSNIRLKHCFIREDTSTFYGGGIFIDRSNVVFSENEITENQTTGTEGNYSSGGGVYCRMSNVSFFKDLIENNEAFTVGGIGFDRSIAVMDSVTICNNTTNGFAGGVYLVDTSNVTINHSQIYENTALNEGGGGILLMNNCWLQINHSVIHHNNAIYGTAVSVSSNSSAGIKNSTIAYNFHNPIFDLSGLVVSASSTLNLNSSILWENGTIEIQKDESCNVLPAYSIIQNGSWEGTGVSQADPQFQNAAVADFRLNWNDYPLPDGGKSGAIDTGDPLITDDPDGTRADMGAFPFEQIYTPINAGNLSGTLTCANSPYYILGNVTIPSGSELIIEPCVKMIARGDYEIKVQGRLLAEGNETDKIVFAASDTLEGWQGIRFSHTNSNGQDTSIIDHCRITYGNANGWSEYKRGGALYFYSSGDVIVKNCLINKNKAENNGGAIYATGSGVTFTNNIFKDNYCPHGGVFYGNSAGSVYFTDNRFQNNLAENGGALAAYSSTIYLAGNTFTNNRAEKFGGAIYYASGGNFNFDAVHKNNVYENYAGAAGLDFYYNGYQSSVNIVLDTFTVNNPNKHFAHPLSKYNITNDHYTIQQTSLDLYVSPFGSDDNTGANIAESLKTLKMACMKIMADAGNPKTIFLDAGTYSETYTGETFPINWRDFVSLQGNGIDITILDGENKNQILYCYDDSDLNISGITVQNGVGENGGGIRLERESSPTVHDIKVTNNYATTKGGGIYCYDHSSPVFTNVDFVNNTCDNHGGGISLYQYCDATISNCIVSNNFTVYYGGGVDIQFYSNVHIDSSIIHHNTAAHGGGIFINWGSDAKIRNCTIQSNDALSHVSGYSGQGGGIYITYQSDPILENNEIKFNHASSLGGGIFSSSQSYTVARNCFVEYNSATSGGGIYLTGNANHTYYNLVLFNNSIEDGFGGGIYSAGSYPKFYNATITDNSVTTDNPSIYTGGAFYNYNGTPEFHNSILWDNVPNEIYLYNGSADVSYSDIKGGYSGTGNIDIDPELTYVFYTNESSPCINAGNPDTTGMNLPDYDIIDSARIVNNRIDMGAYELSEPTHFTQFYLTLFLEGPFNGIDMDTWLTTNPDIAEQFPLSQPFNTAPWNYAGDESTTLLPEDVVDWVLFEIRDASSPAEATSATIKARQTGLLLRDGTVVSPDGTSFLAVENLSIDHSMYLVIWHRNHLGIMSSIGSPIGSSHYYNFFDSDAAVYNGYLGGYKELAPDIWGMVAGDANGDGDIDNFDKAAWQAKAGKSIYTPDDLNLDGTVNNNDKNDLWYINRGDTSYVPD